MASPERVDWKRRVEEHVNDPAALDGMRNAFQTTLGRQAQNLPRMRGLEARRERAKAARKESAGGVLLAEAVANLEANHIRVVGPCSKAEAQEAVLRELGDERLVVKSKSNVTKEIELTKSLEENGVVVVETDAGDRIIQIAGRKQAHPAGPAVDLTRYEVADILAKHFGRSMASDPEVLTKVIRQDVRSYIDSSKIGITGANYITAEEGAVVIIHNEGNAAECARRPLKHVIVTSTDKVVGNLDEAMNLVRLQTYYATGKIISQYVNVISGPSMTADIEKKTFYGMHGPDEVVLVLVDNGRSGVKEKEVLECVNCGACLLECPVYDVVGKDFGGPAHLGGRGVCFTSHTDSLDVAIGSGLALCTNCGLCKTTCPVSVDTPALMRSTRAAAVEASGPLDKDLDALAKSIANYGNPWLQSRTARAKWAEGLDLPQKGDVLYYAGCSHSLLSPGVSRDATMLLCAFGQKVAYLGKDEGCCGSVLLKTGQSQAYLRAKKKAIEAITRSGAKKVVTACPGCFAALSSWKGDGLSIEVEHISQTVDRLLEAHPGRFRSSDELVTYHDPCDLGRQGGIYDEPRRLLLSVPGVRIVEMGHNRDRALCCGSGGGVKTAFPRLAGAIASKRVAEARASGARTLVTACPWCESNLSEAARSSGSDVDIVDLVAFLAARLTDR